MRLRIGGARIRDRYRVACWTGRITLSGAALLDLRGVGFDRPEQTAWREGPGVVGFRTATQGNTDGVELTLSALEGARITFETEIHGYVKVGDPLAPPPHVHAPRVRLEASGRDLIERGSVAVDLPGVELRASLERVSSAPRPRDVSGEIPLEGLGLAPGREHPLFLTARGRDQSRVWTSPLFPRTGARNP